MKTAGEPRIIPLADIPRASANGSLNLWPVAYDLRRICTDPANEDLVLDFRETVEGYSKSLGEVYERLVTKQGTAQEHPDQYQSFLAFVPQENSETLETSGRLVLAGLGVIAIAQKENVPEGIDPTWSNVSSLISAPFRGQGLGGLLLSHRLEVIDSQSKTVWTSIRTDNVVSQGNVLKRGFQHVSRSIIKGVLKDHYVRRPAS
jgi:GNAT superfamily N-acetyltransferase